MNKKLLAIILSVMMLFVFGASFERPNDPDVSVSSGDVLYKKVSIKLDKNKRFVNDYMRTYRGIKLEIRKGTSWSSYVKLKDALDDMPDFGKLFTKSIILSPKHPEVELFNDLEADKRSPAVTGVTDCAGNIAIRDLSDTDYAYMDSIDITLYHEMTHNIIFKEESSISEDASDLYKEAQKQAKNKKSDQYIDMIFQYDPNEVEFFCDVAAIYLAGPDNDSPEDRGHIDYDYFKNTYPEVFKYAEDFVDEFDKNYTN